MANKIRIRRGIREHLPDRLDIGELALCTNTREVFIGTEDGNLKVNEAEKISGNLNIIGDLIMGIEDDDSVNIINEIKALKGLNISSGKDMSLVSEDNLKIEAEYGGMELDSNRDIDINADVNIKFDAGSTFDVAAKRIEAHTESGIKMTTDGSFTFAAGEGAFDVSTETVSIGGSIAELRGGDLSLLGRNKMSISGGKDVEILSDDILNLIAPGLNLEAGYNLAIDADKTTIKGSKVNIFSDNGLDIQAQDITAKSLGTVKLVAKDIAVNADNGSDAELIGGELSLKGRNKLSIISDNEISVVSPNNMLVDVDSLNMDIKTNLTIDIDEKAEISTNNIDISADSNLALQSKVDIAIGANSNIDLIAQDDLKLHGGASLNISSGYIAANSSDHIDIDASGNINFDSEAFAASSRSCTSIDSEKSVSINGGNYVGILSKNNMDIIAPGLNIEAGYNLTIDGDKTTVKGDSIDISSINGLNLRSKDNITLDSSNSLILKSENIQTHGTVHNLSDERDKADIRPTELGLDFIKSLKPVDFKWDYRDDYYEIITLRETEKDTNGKDKLDENGNPIFKTERVRRDKDGSKKRINYHHGLIAQDVKKVIDKTGFDFGGFTDHSANGSNDVLTISYEELISPMIKAIQEQAEMIQELKNKVAALEK